jgi:hypothetical protein
MGEYALTVTEPEFNITSEYAKCFAIHKIDKKEEPKA